MTRDVQNLWNNNICMSEPLKIQWFSWKNITTCFISWWEMSRTEPFLKQQQSHTTLPFEPRGAAAYRLATKKKTAHVAAFTQHCSPVQPLDLVHLTLPLNDIAARAEPSLQHLTCKTLEPPNLHSQLSSAFTTPSNSFCLARCNASSINITWRWACCHKKST